MSTPLHKRRPAKLEALKAAKELEIYTIKKLSNEEHFKKKKYRKVLAPTILEETKNCYTLLVKADACKDKAKAILLANEAMLCVEAVLAQLDTANVLYETPIPNIEYWAGKLVDLKGEIERWERMKMR